MDLQTFLNEPISFHQTQFQPRGQIGIQFQFHRFLNMNCVLPCPGLENPQISLAEQTVNCLLCSVLYVPWSKLLGNFNFNFYLFEVPGTLGNLFSYGMMTSIRAFNSINSCFKSLEKQTKLTLHYLETPLSQYNLMDYKLQ